MDVGRTPVHAFGRPGSLHSNRWITETGCQRYRSECKEGRTGMAAYDYAIPCAGLLSRTRDQRASERFWRGSAPALYHQSLRAPRNAEAVVRSSRSHAAGKTSGGKSLET